VNEPPHVLRRLDAARFDDDAPNVDRFGLLLLSVIGTLVVLSLVDLAPRRADAASDTGVIVVTVFVSIMLVLAVRAAGVARRWRRVAAVIAALAVAGSILLLFSDLVTGDGARAGTTRPTLIWIFISLLLPVIVVRRILTHRRVGLSTLLGAISAYLLIAFAFTFAFLTVDGYGSSDFFGDREPTTSFMYFSLTTMTTTGFGDLTAATNLGRLLATTEAVVGQIFLVTLVALLVGLYAQERRHPDG
jgi:drug/metabolite transporter (DMT)-like permease